MSGRVSDHILIDSGLTQGDVMDPKLFSIFCDADAYVSKFLERSYGIQNYAKGFQLE